MGEIMKKENWIEHMEQATGLTRPSQGGNKNEWNAAYREHKANGCLLCRAYQRTHRANFNRRAREEAYKSAGLTKVYGAVSGKVYWE
jgi:hypothetical protein